MNSPNKYVNNYFWEPRQKLVEDLIIQAIRMHGMYIKYIPRENFVRDDVMGEDTYNKYDYAFEIEVYVNNFDSMGGQGDFLSKFGLEIKDQITFVVAKRRWQESTSKKLILETGQPIELESTPEWKPQSSQNILLEDGGGNTDYDLIRPQPRAGDLIYFPMVDKLFEINQVEHEKLFYQHGTLMTFELTCELFKYSNEVLDTEDADIDKIEDLFGTSYDFYSALTEDGERIILDGFGPLVLEEASIAEIDKTAQNELFELSKGQYVDFTEQSPFIGTKEW